MKQIAIYGKGGIGKSTIAANLSAAMASAGMRVLQVGCDPKQDSTRLLLGGRRIATALDYLRGSQPNSRRLDGIVHTGFSGVSCVEAGGPEPGVGCAGRGILSTFDLLDQLGINERGYDIALYDVLGDVVCGGFAVPLREEYAEAVYIVTSGEFMALYAGNNILRGVRNYEGRGHRIGGIIFNQRGLEHEDQRLNRFAEAVRLPIVASFPRSEQFAEAECLGQTIRQAFPGSELAERFQQLAEYVSDNPPRLAAYPLDPDELETVVLGLKRSGSSSRSGVAAIPASPPGVECSIPSPLVAPPRRFCSKSVQSHEVLHGCAFNGAAHTVLQIKDAVTVAHGPASCAYLSSLGMVSAARRVLDRYGVRLDHCFRPALRCSEMDERIVIFGGNEGLALAVRQAEAGHPGAIFVVTTCAAGIIGDDARLSVAAVREQIGETPVVLIQADGDITGDYMQGVIDAMMAAAKALIDPCLSPDEDSVNIIAEKNLANNTEHNYQVIRDLLGELGLRVNCRFIRDCTTTQLAGFMRARLNLLAYDDSYGRMVRDFLKDHYQAPFLSSPFPVGFHATANWLQQVTARFGKAAVAEDIISYHCAAYEKAMAKMRPSLQGKRLFVTAQSHRIDWILETALNLGMKIVKVGILESPWDDLFMTRYERLLPIEWPYAREKRVEDMKSLKPDLTLTGHPWRGMPEGFRFDTVPLCPDVGFYSGATLARRWQRLMLLPAKEGWRNDL